VNFEHLVNKPLVVYVNGARHEIGTVTRAVVKDGNLFVAASLGRESEDES
jgi:hypothetical protein